MRPTVHAVVDEARRGDVREGDAALRARKDGVFVVRAARGALDDDAAAAVAVQGVAQHAGGGVAVHDEPRKRVSVDFVPLHFHPRARRYPHSRAVVAVNGVTVNLAPAVVLNL
jgi:hypothetical protein